MKMALSKISVHLPGMAKALFSIQHFEVASGTKVLIQGPSGKGKTTLLHLMAGLLLPAEGSVLADAVDLVRLSEVERSRFRRSNMGIIFQKLNLISHLTAQENIMLGMGSRNVDPTPASVVLDKVKLLECADVLAQNLSLGQQQRVAVARVLTQKPKLVLADEPTSSLDDESAASVMQSLLGLAKGTTLIVVSHDHRIREMFDQVHDFSKLVRA
jgi:ABC-type lipoprotein export system ATPase subunit